MTKVSKRGTDIPMILIIGWTIYSDDIKKIYKLLIKCRANDIIEPPPPE